MTQHILLVWVHEAGSKPLQRGSWWVNCVPQVRRDIWMIQNFVHLKGEHGVWDSQVQIAFCPRSGTQFHSFLLTRWSSISWSKKMPACFADHLLLLPYSGFVLPFGILFSGHTAELWDVAQLYHSLLCCHPADENTRLAPSWLPVLSQFLTTRRLHNTPHSRICCSRRHLWPCHLCPHQHPLCMGCTLLYAICCWEQRLPTRQVPCCDYTATEQGVISADSGPCCTAQNESEKELGEMSPLRQLRILSRSCFTGPRLALSGRELEKKTSIVQYCSFPTAYREASMCHEPMKARTFHGSCQLVMVVTLASCLGSGHSKCNCRLYLSDSSLYHQFYCIAQNQF